MNEIIHETVGNYRLTVTADIPVEYLFRTVYSFFSSPGYEISQTNLHIGKLAFYLDGWGNIRDTRYNDVYATKKQEELAIREAIIDAMKEVV